jgi:hypothetical protein
MYNTFMRLRLPLAAKKTDETLLFAQPERAKNAPLATETESSLSDSISCVRGGKGVRRTASSSIGSLLTN